MLSNWVERVLFGYWMHSGMLNWDTGLGVARWMKAKTWAYALQGLLTPGSMVACINAIVAGVAIALALRSLIGASAEVSAVLGAVSAVVAGALFVTWGIRRFKRAAAVVGELYDWESSGIAAWSDRVGGTGS